MYSHNTLVRISFRVNAREELPKSAKRKSAVLRKHLSELSDSGYIKVARDDLFRGAITITDQGKQYLSEHGEYR